MILLTAFLFGTNSPDLALPEWAQISGFPLNVGTASALVYSFLYILMEPFAGTLLAPLLLSATAVANHLTNVHGATANKWALGIHLISWVAQFIGHGKFEGRAPALLDNLIQAIFLAPFFVWLEALFWFGYRPELRKRLDASVEQKISKFKQTRVDEAKKEYDGITNGKVQ
ncbi:MAG: hypothetical protein Q9159_001796 [Coniocarpon cinnabarinum]